MADVRPPAHFPMAGADLPIESPSELRPLVKSFSPLLDALDEDLSTVDSAMSASPAAAMRSLTLPVNLIVIVRVLSPMRLVSRYRKRWTSHGLRVGTTKSPSATGRRARSSLDQSLPTALRRRLGQLYAVFLGPVELK